MYNIGIKDVYTDSESESSNYIDTGTNVYIYIYTHRIVKFGKFDEFAKLKPSKLLPTYI